ncbi:MAG: HlyD family efflux transporter periplasmic adaptor subunit [Chloroflexota bacterium]|nr:HlyD family efflux transporter periplasmic adaptor subunit [Chloroflexota bacterium]
MKRTTLYVILGIVVVVVAVIGAVVWQPWLAQQPEEEARTAVVERGTLLITVSATGNIQPEARVDLSFEMPGRIAEVLVEVGDVVQSGDPLARLDSEQLALQMQQAEAAMEAAQAQLSLVKAGARSEQVAAAEASVRAAEAQVSAAAANRDQLESGASDAQVAAAEAGVAAAELQYKVTQIEHDRIVNETEDAEKKEQARYDLYTADKALAAAQAGLDAALAGADEDMIRAARAGVSAAAAQADAAQATLDLLLAGATDEQIASVEAQVAQAQVALDMVELLLDHATLRAPFDGIIAEFNITAEEMASAGLPAISLIDTSKLYITVGVDEIDVSQLVEGQAVQVTLDALPGVEIAGTVERIAPDATTRGSVVYYDTVIELAPTDVPILADMTANVTIVVEELVDVLIVPTWVVRVDRDTGQHYVQRQEGEQTERVDVQLGVRGNGVVQVLSGLEEGDVLLLVQEEMIEVIREQRQ